MSDHLVSVIIPARRAPQLTRTLDSLLTPANRARLAEIIVIDDGDRVFTDNIIRHIQPDRPCTAPVARNLGIAAARSPWLAFIDADCVAAPDWLDKMLRAAADGHPVVGGGVEFGRTSYWARVHNVSMLHEFHVSAASGPRRFLPSLNLLVQRRVIEQVGVMNEAFRRAQDLEWTARMTEQDIALWFEAGARVTHLPDRTRGSLWIDYAETGRASYRVRAKSGRQQAVPGWLNSPAGLRWLSPLIAAAATTRLFIQHPALIKYWPTIPGVWFTKLAWCFGAANAAEEEQA